MLYISVPFSCIVRLMISGILINAASLQPSDTRDQFVTLFTSNPLLIVTIKQNFRTNHFAKLSCNFHLCLIAREVGSW